jgi:hypothetical protein
LIGHGEIDVLAALEKIGDDPDDFTSGIEERAAAAAVADRRGDLKDAMRVEPSDAAEHAR